MENKLGLARYEWKHILQLGKSSIYSQEQFWECGVEAAAIILVDYDENSWIWNDFLLIHSQSS